jgi:hypothetical protein
MTGILALARRYRVPVLLHVEWTRMRELSALLERFSRRRGDLGAWRLHAALHRPADARAPSEPDLRAERRTWPVHPRSPDYTILRDGQAVWPQWLELIETQPDRFVVGTDASQRSADSER